MAPSARYLVSLGIIGGGLAVSIGHHVLFALQYGSVTVELLAGFLPPVLAAAAAVPLVVFVHASDLETAHIWRAAVWYLGGALVFAVAVSLTLSQTIQAGNVDAGVRFSVANWAISGSFVGLVVANYDLRRTRAIIQARASQRTADRIAQRLSVLNRVLRHDVRNKTNIILGYVQQLEGDLADSEAVFAIEDAATTLTDIAERARRVRHIVEDESPRAVHLTPVVADLVAALRDDYPDARITAELADDVHARTYPAVRTALAELLANTMEHNPQPEADREARVTLRRLATPPGERVEIAIEDNGPGIPDREQLVVTDERETQLEHSRGMSLWLTRWIVDESGGEFTIDTAAVDGTRVTLRLPVAAADAA